nr:uncharacterized protein At5g50100, mitochondrial [Ipomoea batatas]
MLGPACSKLRPSEAEVLKAYNVLRSPQLSTVGRPTLSTYTFGRHPHPRPSTATVASSLSPLLPGRRLLPDRRFRSHAFDFGFLPLHCPIPTIHNLPESRFSVKFLP